MKWINVADKKPSADGMYYIAARRNDGSIYCTESWFCFGELKSQNGVIRKDFFSMSSNVVAWLPYPEPFSRTSRGNWNIAGEIPPPKDGTYFVTVAYTYGTRTKISFYLEKKDTFTGYPDVIAWQKLPEFKNPKRLGI